MPERLKSVHSELLSSQFSWSPRFSFARSVWVGVCLDGWSNLPLKWFWNWIENLGGLGMPTSSKTDEFSEKFQTAFDHNAFNLCPWFGQSRISLDNVILSLDNVMTFLISSPILDNMAWFRLSPPDYGQFCTFSYISQNIMDNSVPFV